VPKKKREKKTKLTTASKKKGQNELEELGRQEPRGVKGTLRGLGEGRQQGVVRKKNSGRASAQNPGCRDAEKKEA